MNYLFFPICLLKGVEIFADVVEGKVGAIVGDQGESGELGVPGEPGELGEPCEPGESGDAVELGVQGKPGKTEGDNCDDVEVEGAGVGTERRRRRRGGSPEY